MVINTEELEKVGNLERKIREEKKPPDKTVLNTNKEKAGEDEKLVKVGNIEGKIREEKKLPDKTIYSDNRKKAGKAKEFEKASNLERKMLVFGKNKIKAKHININYNGRLN